MGSVFQQKQRSVEEQLLGFSHGYAMFFVLARVAAVPVEPRNLAQVNHFLYITIMYKYNLLAVDVTPVLDRILN